MRRIITLTTVVAALGVGATSATAAPPSPFDQGNKLCLRQGGDFLSNLDTYYECQTIPVSLSWGDRDLSQAAKLCSRNGGLFLDGFWYYRCEW